MTPLLLFEYIIAVVGGLIIAVGVGLVVVRFLLEFIP